MLLFRKRLNFTFLSHEVTRCMMLGKFFSSFNDESDASESAASYKKKFFEMPLQEKRKLYQCGSSYVVLDDVPIWPVLYKVDQPKIKKIIQRQQKKKTERTFKFKEDEDIPKTSLDLVEKLNTKVSLWQGDLTKLEIDAIVNAAKETLLGGGGVDGCIHRAAGPSLRKECQLLDGAKAGEAKLTCGHKLPAKYIIHTVGPRGKKPSKLKECYENCLQIALENEIRSIAFCCISTGVFGYPNRDAAHVALLVVRKWLEKNGEKVDRVIFCTFLKEDFEIYEELMADKYFPCEQPVEPPSETDDDRCQSDASPQKNVVIEAGDETKVEDKGIGTNKFTENGEDKNVATDLSGGDHKENENTETLETWETGNQDEDNMDIGSQQPEQESMEFGSQPLS